MYRLFSFLYPQRIKTSLIQLLSYSNVKIQAERFLGLIFVYNFLFSLFLGFLFGKAYALPFWILFFVFFFIIQLGVYLWLLVYADKKARFVEEVLPDALLLMASNLRAGFTVDKALLLAARPEFGPFKDEILQVGKEITAGHEITASLLAISKRVRSQKLARALELITTGIKSGGKLADLLQETAVDFKNQHLVDRKIRSSVNMYVIFIFIAVAFGAPLLFALSSYLVEVLTSVFKTIDIPTSASAQFSMPISVSTVTIDLQFVVIYSIVSLVTSSIFGSFIIGLISKGREKDGITLLPVLILISLTLFFMIRIFARSLLSGLFNF